MKTKRSVCLKSYFLCLLIGTVMSCQKSVGDQLEQARYEKRAFSAMGSVLTVELWSLKTSKDQASEIYKIIDTVEQSISHYIASSKVSQINLNAGKGRCTELDHNFKDILNLSIRDYHQSNTYFNPAVGPLMQYFEKVSDNPAEILSDQTVSLLKLDHQLMVKNRCAQLKNEGASLNFSANGKGYALKKIQDYLNQTKEITKSRITLGEQVLMWSQNKEEQWVSYLRNPDKPSEPLAKWVTGNGSIASSARYGKKDLVLNDETAYIIDPVSMKKILQQKMTSVFHKNPYQADVFSTLFHILNCDEDKIKKMYPNEKYKSLCLSGGLESEKKQIGQGKLNAKTIFLSLNQRLKD